MDILLFYVHHYSGRNNVYGGESAYYTVDIYDWFYMAKWLVEKEKEFFFKKELEYIRF